MRMSSASGTSVPAIETSTLVDPARLLSSATAGPPEVHEPPFLKLTVLASFSLTEQVARTGVPSGRNSVYLVDTDSTTPTKSGSFFEPHVTLTLGGRFSSSLLEVETWGAVILVS